MGSFGKNALLGLPILSEFWESEAPAEPFPEEAPLERRPTAVIFSVH
jgi:hypothetical protein